MCGHGGGVVKPVWRFVNCRESGAGGRKGTVEPVPAGGKTVVAAVV